MQCYNFVHFINFAAPWDLQLPWEYIIIDWFEPKWKFSVFMPTCILLHELGYKAWCWPWIHVFLKRIRTQTAHTHTRVLRRNISVAYLLTFNMLLKVVPVHNAGGTWTTGYYVEMKVLILTRWWFIRMGLPDRFHTSPPEHFHYTSATNMWHWGSYFILQRTAFNITHIYHMQLDWC
jgi:hypothetical protein